MLEDETTYNTLEEELFALRFAECITKDEKKLKIIKEKIKKVKRQMIKERINENDKHKRK